MVATRRRSRITELTDGQLIHLSTGRDFFRDGFGQGEELDEDIMREAWRDHREEIEQYCAESWPGSIPYARLRFGAGLSREDALASLNWPPHQAEQKA